MKKIQFDELVDLASLERVKNELTLIEGKLKNIIKEGATTLKNNTGISAGELREARKTILEVEAAERALTEAKKSKIAIEKEESSLRQRLNNEKKSSIALTEKESRAAERALTETKKSKIAIEKEESRLRQQQNNEKKSSIALQDAENRSNERAAKLLRDKSSAYKQMSITLENNRRKWLDLAAAGQQNTREAKELLKTVKQQDAAIKKLDATVGRYTRSVGNYQRAFGALGSVMGAFGIGTGIFLAVDAARSIYNNTIEIDRYNKALKQVSSSNADFRNSQKYIKDLAEETGSEIFSLTDSFIKFKAATNGTNLEGEQTQKIFRAVAKSGAALGLSAEDQAGALKALGQMISKGKIQAEELRGQLGDRLPRALQIMASAMGVTTQQLDKMMKKGELYAEEVLPLMAKEMEKTFGVDNENRIMTLRSEITRLGNTLKMMFDSGDGIEESNIAKALKYIIWLTSELIESLEIAAGMIGNTLYKRFTSDATKTEDLATLWRIGAEDRGFEDLQEEIKLLNEINNEKEKQIKLNSLIIKYTKQTREAAIEYNELVKGKKLIDINSLAYDSEISYQENVKRFKAMYASSYNYQKTILDGLVAFNKKQKGTYQETNEERDKREKAEAKALNDARDKAKKEYDLKISEFDDLQKAEKVLFERELQQKNIQGEKLIVMTNNFNQKQIQDKILFLNQLKALYDDEVLDKDKTNREIQNLNIKAIENQVDTDEKLLKSLLDRLNKERELKEKTIDENIKSEEANFKHQQDLEKRRFDTMLKTLPLREKQKEDLLRKFQIKQKRDEIDNLKVRIGISDLYSVKMELQKNIDVLNAEIEDLNTKAYESTRINYADMLELAQEYANARFDIEKNRLEREEEAHRSHYEYLKDLAANQTEGALDNMAYEQKKQADIQAKKDKLAKNEKYLDATLAGLKVYLAHLDSSMNAKSALVSTATDLTTLKALIRGISSSFYVGTEDTGKGGDIDEKGGFHAILHPHERVFNRQDNQLLGSMSNKEVVNNAIAYKRGGDSAYINKKIDQLIKVIDSKPVYMGRDYDATERAIIDVVMRGRKIERNHKRLKSL